MLSQEVTVVFAGALAGLLPVILTFILSWIEKRSLATKQNRALDLAMKHIEFLDSWMNVQERLCSTERLEEIKKDSSVELDQLRKSLSERLTEEEKVEEQSERNIVQRLFLIYWPHNVAGWVLHTIFYMFLSMTVLALTVAGFDLETEQFSFSTFLSELPWLIALLILPMIVIRWLAVKADNKHNESN